MAPTNKKRLRDNDQHSDSDSENERSYNSCNNWPRFLVVESTSDDFLLNKLSPFAVQKGFQAVWLPPKAHLRGQQVPYVDDQQLDVSSFWNIL